MWMWRLNWRFGSIGYIQQRIDIVGSNVESIAHAVHVPPR